MKREKNHASRFTHHASRSAGLSLPREIDRVSSLPREIIRLSSATDDNPFISRGEVDDSLIISRGSPHEIDKVSSVYLPDDLLISRGESKSRSVNSFLKHTR